MMEFHDEKEEQRVKDVAAYGTLTLHPSIVFFSCIHILERGILPLNGG